ncbi:MAG: tyrosine-type recombinase/integrase [Reyranellaceae bacterium]
MPKLTKRFVDALKPVERDTLYRDTDLAGFALRAKPTGVATWVVQYRNSAGRTRKLALGKVGVLTPDEARRRAREALTDASSGGDPSADRHALRTDLTVAELVEIYLTEGPASKPAKKATSWQSDASNLRRHVIPLLGRRQLASLTSDDLQKFQRDVTDGKTRADERTRKRGRAIVTGGPVAATRTTLVLSAMLQWATTRKFRPDNPGKGIKLNKPKQRERFLSAAELARLGEAFANGERQGLNPNSLAILRLLVLTGARRNEIASLRWDYVDFERKALRLPDSKTGAKIVPLGAPALTVLNGLPRKPGSPWVFPAATGAGHHVGMPRVWRKLKAMARLSDVRMHDLRHGFASIAVADGSSLYLVGKVLGHTQASTTQRYAHLHLDPVRAVADRTSRKLAGALKGGGNGPRLVSLRDRRRA